MSICDTCGNDYDHTFTVGMDGADYTFDCFECAIHKLAPTCPNCSCRIIGHGVQHGSTIFCCVHCAEKAGADGLADRR